MNQANILARQMAGLRRSDIPFIEIFVYRQAVKEDRWLNIDSGLKWKSVRVFDGFDS